ncbi:hypothetical protein C4D60_Mb11t13070 [Musa balbisiana]|uniref:Uncharacterized protein n=1 Tax=Musa balbisiana TaxID=52838 RepID=A0A4S8J4M9_MUSBA|nr:hypothetical protein C4D60_Mb11t13070 [Musa balbisiana]
MDPRGPPPPVRGRRGRDRWQRLHRPRKRHGGGRRRIILRLHRGSGHRRGTGPVYLREGVGDGSGAAEGGIKGEELLHCRPWVVLLSRACVTGLLWLLCIKETMGTVGSNDILRIPNTGMTTREWPHTVKNGHRRACLDAINMNELP